MQCRTGLKQSVLDSIRGDGDLLAIVCKALDTTPTYALRMVREDDPRLTQADVLKGIKEYKISKGEGCNDSDLLEEKQLESADQQ
jgi:hypothetical protein